ncbi:MAG TPA: hypothetical protein VJ326_05590 [Thermoplasmata archaeon]|nr:hypothetical protein [Thermoplasmata archaeon]
MKAAFAAALGILALLILATAGTGAPIRSYYVLDVTIIEGESPAYAIRFDLDSPFNANQTETMARTLDINVTLGPELTPQAIEYGTCTSGACTASQPNSTGDRWFNMSLRISDDAARQIQDNPGVPFFAELNVVVVYTDLEGARPRTIQRTVSMQLNYDPPARADVLPVALAGLGGAGVIGLGLYVGGRARLDELYLMHDSGMLIRHWSRKDGSLHDTDIMSGMFIVLQEFVRDSFADRQNALEQLRFGKQQVVMVRGSHTWLAGVVRGRYLNGLPKRLHAAILDFEFHYAETLKDWNGNVDSFPGVDVVAWRFMKGRATVAGAAS